MGKLSLVHRIYAALSRYFLGLDGPCHRLLPHGLHVSLALPSVVWYSKLSVHIFVCWKVTSEASFSALMVTDILLLILHTVFPVVLKLTPWNGGDLDPEPTFFSDGAWLLKERDQSSTVAVVLNEYCARLGNIPASLHFDSTFVYLTLVLVSTAQMLFCHFESHGLEHWVGNSMCDWTLYFLEP